MHNECGKVLVFQVENAEKCRKIGFRKWICNVENAVEKWKTRMWGRFWLVRFLGFPWGKLAP